jgi:hypothetical protein
MENERQHAAADWDEWALRYVAAELTDEEQRWFEQRLAEDLTACQAVAHAVELTCAVAVAERSSTPPSAKRRAHRKLYRSPVAWLAVGLAASLLVAVGVWRLQPAAPESDAVATEEASEDDPSAEDLAYAWWQARLEAMTEDEAETPVPALASDEPPASSLLSPAEAALAPDWMLSAVASAEEESMDEDEDDTEEDADAETEAETRLRSLEC